MTPLVLLPGMMCDARLFQPQIAAFSARWVVHCAPISGHDTVEALAENVLNSAPPSFALVGLSMGGIVAMEILRQAPHRVEKVALLDTNPLAELPEVRARRHPQIAQVENGELAIVMRDEMKPNYLAESPNRTAILDLCMEMALGLGADVFVRQSKALAARPDQTETLRKVTQPALVLCGRQDSLCPVERHELIRDLIPDAQMQVIEEAGHLVTLERPEETNGALLRWLER